MKNPKLILILASIWIVVSTIFALVTGATLYVAVAQSFMFLPAFALVYAVVILLKYAFKT